MDGLSRREFLSKTPVTGLAAGVFLSGSPTAIGQTAPLAPKFKYCLNTSTIRGQRLPLDQSINLIGEAGYNAVEPWINEIQQYQQSGGNLQDLRNRISDLGLSVEGAIGFANWIDDDDTRRNRGLEQAKRDMELVSQIGGTSLAAPPSGATNRSDMDLARIAERYHALLEIGRETGVVPALELWGFSQTLSRLGEVAYVAIESGHPDACILLDVYHIYKGGSDFKGLNTIAGKAVAGLHMNDYPATPPRETISDGDRVYPGDGIAPISEILRTLAQTGFSGYLSLELFNESYWQQDAREVLKTGLAKMKTEVQKAFV